MKRPTAVASTPSSKLDTAIVKFWMVEKWNFVAPAALMSRKKLQKFTESYYYLITSANRNRPQTEVRLCRGDWLMIPPSLHKMVLEEMHKSQFGVERTRWFKWQKGSSAAKRFWRWLSQTAADNFVHPSWSRRWITMDVDTSVEHSGNCVRHPDGKR